MYSFPTKEIGGIFFTFFFLLFFFIIKYSLLRYKKLHGALAMAETKPQNNPTARFTSSWDKQIPPTRRKAIKHEDRNRTPWTLWYGPNRTPATSLN